MQHADFRVNIMERKSTNSPFDNVNISVCLEFIEDTTCLFMKLADLGWVSPSAAFDIFHI